MYYTSRYLFNKKFYEVRNLHFFEKNGTTGRDRSISKKIKYRVETSNIYRYDRYVIAVMAQ